MPLRRRQLYVHLLILLNLLLQNCQAPSHNICTGEVPTGLDQSDGAACQDTSSLSSEAGGDGGLAPVAALPQAFASQSQDPLGDFTFLEASEAEGDAGLALVDPEAIASQWRASVAELPAPLLSVVRSASPVMEPFSEQFANFQDMRATFDEARGVSSIDSNADPSSSAPCQVYRTCSGEYVSFRREVSRWWAVLRPTPGAAHESERIVPVVSKEDIQETLLWLQAQDSWVARSRIHLLSQSGSPHGSCVYLGKHSLLSGMQGQEEEFSKLIEKYHRERAERERLQRECVELNQTHKRELCVLEQSKEEYKRAYKFLKFKHVGLKSDIRKLQDRQQRCESAFASLSREKDFYKSRFEELRVRYSGLKSGLEDNRRKYEETFADLAREQNMYKDQCKALQTENWDLKSDLEELNEYRKEHETISASLVSERDMYKYQYEELRSEHLDLKSYVARYQGPERVLFQPFISGKVFGKEEWASYFGDVGSEPPIPPDLNVILGRSCPFWPGSSIRDTHLLVLVPVAVNGKPFTLDLLGSLVENPRGGGRSTKCCYQSNDVKKEFGSRQPLSCNSYWALVTKSVLPDSQCRTFEEQELFVAEYERKTGLKYVIPSPLEAATAILSHYVRSGERICPDSPRTYTRCTGTIDHIYPVYVGLFSLQGLNIGIDSYDSSSLGGGTLCLCKL